MPLPPLVRRRELPVPTASGALVALGLAAALAWLLLRGLYPFLAPTDALGDGLLVVEGWAGSPAFDEAANRFEFGRYHHVVATGGPIERDSPIAGARTWAEWGAAGLAARGVAREVLATVAPPASAQDRTYLSAVAVREWAAAQDFPVTRIDLVTLGPHGRRSRALYRRAFGDGVAIGVISVPSRDYSPARWWRSSEGAKSVLGEAIGWAWTTCCFDPGERGSHRERWGRPE